MARVSSSIPLLPGDVGSALYDVAQATASDVLDLAAEIAAVPAPTNEEYLRTAYLNETMPALGFSDIYVDELGDVSGRVRGVTDTSVLLVAAHIDTVFPMSTPLTIVREPSKTWGPGIGDNSLGIAAGLKLPQMLRLANVDLPTDVVVTGNVGEEGLGNLRGMTAVMDTYPDVGAVIALEGHNLGRVTHVAVGSRRYRVTVEGPGGHSWGDSSNPNAISAAAEIIHELGRIRLSPSPKTTLNVGTIQGGLSVNSIAPSASFLLDLRSVEERALTRLSNSVENVLATARDGIHVTWEVLGTRPAGVVPAESRIIRLASSILESIGIQPVGDASSTDANIPISRGIPSVCIGLTTGGNVHRQDEYIDNAPLAEGLYQFLALVVTASGFLAHGQL
jgi:acetylornithine deacetylase/succinyl-diaminopimelate desuccinylase-like protein